MHLLPVDDIEMPSEGHVHLKMASECDGRVFRVSGEQTCRMCPHVTNLVPTSFDGVLCIDHALEACGHTPAKTLIAPRAKPAAAASQRQPAAPLPQTRLLFDADDLVRELSACAYILSTGAMTSSITLRLQKAVAEALREMPVLIPLFEAYGWKDTQFQNPLERDAVLQLKQLVSTHALHLNLRTNTSFPSCEMQKQPKDTHAFMVYPDSVEDALALLASTYDKYTECVDRATCAMILLTRRAEWTTANEDRMRKRVEHYTHDRPGLTLYFAVFAPPAGKTQKALYEKFTGVSYAHACEHLCITLVTGVDHTTMLQLISRISQFADVW